MFYLPRSLAQCFLIPLRNSWITCYSIHQSHKLNKIVPDNLKGKSKPSQEWLTRQLNDPYVKKSRYDNYRARSAYKLIEIDNEYRILRPNIIVIDLGASPGSWTQVIVERLKLDTVQPSERGAVIAIDISPIVNVDGAIIMDKMDFTKPLNQALILQLLDGKQADFICSDMAPNATGQPDLDHERIMMLAYSALQFAISVLKPGGAFLVKLWQGSRTPEMLSHSSKFFNFAKMLKPEASRDNSAECFILAKEFKGVVRN